MNPNNRDFHNLEPYTLEWWMYLEGRAREEKEVANNLYNAETHEFGYKRKNLLKEHDRNWHKYNNLVAFIRSRIVQKYGEQRSEPVSLKRIVTGMTDKEALDFVQEIGKWCYLDGADNPAISLNGIKKAIDILEEKCQ